METETISVLKKTQIKKEANKDTASTGCCGGAPVSNENACCKLDEEKKSEGEGGCGCNSTPSVKIGTGCC
jgi:hypothetical protein